MSFFVFVFLLSLLTLKYCFVLIQGNRHDFNSWTANGAYGWSYNEVLPYFIRSEDNQDPDIAYNGYHGRGGPLTVGRSKMISPLAYAFIEAGKLFGTFSLPLSLTLFYFILLFQIITVNTRSLGIDNIPVFVGLP